jgi:hypothetical protein
VTSPDVFTDVRWLAGCLCAASQPCAVGLRTGRDDDGAACARDGTTTGRMGNTPCCELGETDYE